jgi:hypothetical protein
MANDPIEMNFRHGCFIEAPYRTIMIRFSSRAVAANTPGR